MAQPIAASSAAPATPATPAAPQAGAKPVDPKAMAADVGNKPAVDPKGPAEGADKAVPQAAKPTGIEGEIAAQLGEDWDKLPQKAKDRMIAAEMKAREADKRMQLAAKLKKDLDMTNAQVAQLFNALKSDPWKVLSNPALGHDVRKMAEEYVWQMIQEQRMTPEQREAMQTKMELQEMRAQHERAKKEQEEREMQALTEQRRQYWEKSITEEIEKAQLPNTSYTVRRFAEYIRAAARARQPANLPEIANQIRQEIIDQQSKFLLPPRFNNESDEAYEERILKSAPSEFLKLLRKADLKKLRAKGALPKPGPKPAGGPAVSGNGRPKMSMSDWLNQRDQRLGRK